MLSHYGEGEEAEEVALLVLRLQKPHWRRNGDPNTTLHPKSKYICNIYSKAKGENSNIERKREKKRSAFDSSSAIV